MIFDDGYQHIFNDVVPILNDFDLPAVFAVPLSSEAIERTEQLPCTPWQQWLTIRQHGHEIAAHGVHHVDLTTLSDTELRHELQQPVTELGATTLVYPGGAHDQRVQSEAAKLYRAARGVSSGLETLPPKQPYQLTTVNYSRRNWSLAKANLRAYWAHITGRWLLETYHIVSDTEEKLHTVPLREFKQHIEWIHRRSLAMQTISTVLSAV